MIHINAHLKGRGSTPLLHFCGSFSYVFRKFPLFSCGFSEKVTPPVFYIDKTTGFEIKNKRRDNTNRASLSERLGPSSQISLARDRALSEMPDFDPRDITFAAVSWGGFQRLLLANTWGNWAEYTNPKEKRWIQVLPVLYMIFLVVSSNVSTSMGCGHVEFLFAMIYWLFFFRVRGLICLFILFVYLFVFYILVTLVSLIMVHYLTWTNPFLVALVKFPPMVLSPAGTFPVSFQDFLVNFWSWCKQVVPYVWSFLTQEEQTPRALKIQEQWDLIFSYQGAAVWFFWLAVTFFLIWGTARWRYYLLKWNKPFLRQRKSQLFEDPAKQKKTAD